MTNNILDIRDLIERFEELEDARTPWGMNWNMPGYMPDNEAGTYASWEDARDALRDELERYADELDEMQLEENHNVLARIGELKDALDEAKDGKEFGGYAGKYFWEIFPVEREGLDETDADEFSKLKSLLEDLAGNGGDEQWRGDWYPITLIPDYEFEDYARELADDIGAINKNASWPNTCIDWEQAARELQMDYTTVEYDGTTYWYR
jgi:antirestriction protein